MARIRINNRIAERLRIEADKVYFNPDFSNNPEIEREWKIRFARCDAYLRYGDLFSFGEMEKRLIDCGRISAGE